MQGRKDISKLERREVQGRDGRRHVVYVDPNKDGRTPVERKRDDRRDTKARQDRAGYAAETAEDRQKRKQTVERHLEFEKTLKEQRRSGKNDFAAGRVVRVYAQGRVNVGGMLARIESTDGKTAKVMLPSGSVQEVQIQHLQIAKARLIARTRMAMLPVRKGLSLKPLPEPTDAQKEAGNYRKHHIRVHGLDIAIENPKGSVRSGTDAKGKKWKNTLKHHYGYIKGTEGNDGDHVDVFIGPDPESEIVFVVNQINPETGEFDEHKALFGFSNVDEAKEGYLANYDRGWKGIGSIVSMTIAQFKEWLSEGDLTQPVDGTTEADVTKSLIGRLIRVVLKAKPLPVGTQRTHGGRLMEKTPDGWKPVKEKPKEKGESDEKPVKPHQALQFVSAGDLREKEQYTAKKDYDRPTIDGIKESILATGYNPAFPLQVDRGEDGKLNIVSGHHRFTAVQELIKEGSLPSGFKVPVIVQHYDKESDRLMAQVAENVRRTVKPTDEGKAFGRLIAMGVTPQEIAKKTGKDVGAITRRLALNNLTPELYSMVESGKRLPLGIAEAIGMHGLKPDGKPDSYMQLKAFRFYLENKHKGWKAGEVISYLNELKSAQDMKFFEDDGKTAVEQEALKAVGSEEKAKRNMKLLDQFMKNTVASFQKMFGDSISDVNSKTLKEIAASVVAANGEGGFQQKMTQLEAVIQDLSAVKRSLEKEYNRIRQNGDTGQLFATAKSIRWLDQHYDEGVQILKSFREVGT